MVDTEVVGLSWHVEAGRHVRVRAFLRTRLTTLAVDPDYVHEVEQLLAAQSPWELQGWALEPEYGGERRDLELAMGDPEALELWPARPRTHRVDEWVGIFIAPPLLPELHEPGASPSGSRGAAAPARSRGTGRAAAPESS